MATSEMHIWVVKNPLSPLLLSIYQLQRPSQLGGERGLAQLHFNGHCLELVSTFYK